MSSKGSILLLNVRRASIGPAENGSDYLGLFYLAAVLEEKGYDPWVFHGNVHEVPGVLEKMPEVVAVGLACDFENRTAVEELSLFIKETHGLPVVIGGPQAVALGEDFSRRSRCDYIVRGEAEETFPELLDHILASSGRREDIPGIAWMEDDTLRATIDREPVEDLDSLPFPAYHRSLHEGRLYGRSVFTGRGCPFSCAFCAQSRHKRRVRMRRMDSVLEEIRRNLDLSPDLKYITLSDDVFTLQPRRVEAFCTGMRELRRERDLVWYCEGHVHLLAEHPEMLPMMAEAGLVRLQIGVETGSQEVLDLYGKGVRLKEIEFVVREAVRSGIPQVATNLIVGGPLTGEKTLEETANFAERLMEAAPGTIDILTGFLRPYPGTAIAGRPEDFGLTVVDGEGVRSVDDFPLIVSEGVGREDILLHRFILSKRIAEAMRKLLAEGRVPHETILSQYHLALNHGVTSLWYLEFFK
ncbi:MAG: B12-binding domain-containing radical SAM protein, partial [Acidobacteriota bacterium]